MTHPQPVRVHLIVGGFPPGSPAGHDMDYARLRILQLLLHEQPNVRTDSSGSGSKTAGVGWGCTGRVAERQHRWTTTGACAKWSRPTIT